VSPWDAETAHGLLQAAYRAFMQHSHPDCTNTYEVLRNCQSCHLRGVFGRIPDVAGWERVYVALHLPITTGVFNLCTRRLAQTNPDYLALLMRDVASFGINLID
jgi:hypothetical protein